MYNVYMYLSVGSISRRSLKTKHWNKEHKQKSIFAWILFVNFKAQFMSYAWRDSLKDKTAHRSMVLATEAYI